MQARTGGFLGSTQSFHTAFIALKLAMSVIQSWAVSSFDLSAGFGQIAINRVNDALCLAGDVGCEIFGDETAHVNHVAIHDTAAHAGAGAFGDVDALDSHNCFLLIELRSQAGHEWSSKCK